jgi:hypothetical protein
MYALMMASVQPASERTAERATLCNSTVVLLVGNIEVSTHWYERIGFEAYYFSTWFLHPKT